MTDLENLTSQKDRFCQSRKPANTPKQLPGVQRMGRSNFDLSQFYRRHKTWLWTWGIPLNQLPNAETIEVTTCRANTL